MSTNPFRIWLMAIRPKTLWASICPVVMGTAMAFRDGIHHWPSAFVALLGALMLQIGTNLVNDYCDFKKGADTIERTGPIRVTQAGLVKPSLMISVIIIVFLIAISACIYLVQRGGTPIAIIGILAVVSAIGYTAGPLPLGYLGLGEVFVLFFFGPVAVGGTYFVQSLEINNAVLAAGFAPGLFSTGILIVNNLRDLEQDKKANKKTLAVRFGKNFAKAEYFYVVIIACLIPVLIYIITEDYIHSLFSILTILFTYPALEAVFRDSSEGQTFNHVLTYTSNLLFLYTLLFCIGWLI